MKKNNEGSYYILRRAYLTLFELLIVIAILFSIMGVFTFNILKAKQEQQFRFEVDQVVETLRLAQDLMLIFRSNVAVTFLQHANNTMEYFLEIDTPLPQKWDQELERHRRRLRTLTYIQFHDLTPRDLPEGANELRIRFRSGGSVMSRGTMVLATGTDLNSPGVFKRYVCLSGFPKSIVSTAQNPGEPCTQADDAFDQQLTQRTAEELRVQGL